MNPETAFPLPPKGARLLAFIAGRISTGLIKKGQPKTFIAYSEALRGMGISPHGRAGQQLQREGLDDLNDWTIKNPHLPKIAGLIVNKKTQLPSGGFAKSHGRKSGDWKVWWLAETAKAIDFDWSQFLPKFRFQQPSGLAGGRPLVQEDAGAKTPAFRNIITIEPGKRGGKPCIRGMRITVGDILGWLAADMSEKEIIEEYPELTKDDIRAALAYAADQQKRIEPPGFTEKWTGKFTLPDTDPEDDRLNYLIEKYEKNRQ